jgi:hypothetical protein
MENLFYKNKYLKYKFKYLDLKTKITGGNSPQNPGLFAAFTNLQVQAAQDKQQAEQQAKQQAEQQAEQQDAQQAVQAAICAQKNMVTYNNEFLLRITIFFAEPERKLMNADYSIKGRIRAAENVLYPYPVPINIIRNYHNLKNNVDMKSLFDTYNINNTNIEKIIEILIFIIPDNQNINFTKYLETFSMEKDALDDYIDKSKRNYHTWCEYIFNNIKNVVISIDECIKDKCFHIYQDEMCNFIILLCFLFDFIDSNSLDNFRKVLNLDYIPPRIIKWGQISRQWLKECIDTQNYSSEIVLNNR